MNEHSDQRLSKITTLWSIVGRAHGEEGESAREARQQVLEQYGGAVRRYVLAALKDADAADEVFQNFAIQFLKGRLRGADPKRGRFREYLKGVLFRLVADHHRARVKQPLQIADNAPDAVDESCTTLNDDDSFLKSWCDELLLQSWNSLQQLEQESGTPYYTILRLRTEQHALAEQLSSELGKQFQAADRLDPSEIMPTVLAAAREKLTAEEGTRPPDLVGIYPHADGSPVTSVCFSPNGKRRTARGVTNESWLGMLQAEIHWPSGMPALRLTRLRSIPRVACWRSRGCRSVTRLGFGTSRPSDGRTLRNPGRLPKHTQSAGTVETG